MSSLAGFSAPPSYDRTFIAQLIQAAQRELDAGYRKDGNIVVPYGFSISLTGTGGHVATLGLNGSNQFTISIDGATAFALGTDDAILTLTSAYMAADASLSASITSEASTRATADTATASTITTLTATVATNASTAAAAITTEQTARATADTAETNARTSADSTLTTNLATANAAITSEASTRATADSAETSARTSADSAFTTSLATTNAAITSEATTRATADSAETSARTSADSAFTASLATTNANVTSEASTRATADSAEASTRASADATLTTNLSTTNANVTTETTARVNGDNALSSSITSLTTAYQAADTTLQSNITAEASTRSSADSTETTNRTSADSTLQTNINTVSAAVTSEASTRATADSAEASTRASADSTLTTNLATTNANVTAEASTRATNDSAEASTRSSADATLTSGLSTANANISTNTSAIATNTSAISTQTTRVDAVYGPHPNICPNSTFALGLQNWAVGAAGFAAAGPASDVGFYAYSGTSGAIIYSDEFSVYASNSYTLSANSGGISYTTGCYVAVNWYTSGHAYISTTHFIQQVAGVGYGRLTATATSPGTAAYARVQVGSPTVAGGGYYLAYRIKLELGGTASPWADDRDSNLLNASVSNIAEAYATNSGSYARLLWRVATGTNIAEIVQSAHSGYSDGTWNGSVIKLAADMLQLLAKNIDFGTNTHFEDTKGTIYTVAGSYRIRILGSFGASSDCVLWYGLNSVALNSETRTNGIFALGTDGVVYYGAAALSTSANFGATKSGDIGGTTVGNTLCGGSTVTITPGGGTPPYSHSFAILDGDTVTLNGVGSSSTATLSTSFTFTTHPTLKTTTIRDTIRDSAGRVTFCDIVSQLEST